MRRPGVGRRSARGATRRLKSVDELQQVTDKVIPLRARILGLDPGSLVTGYAVLECNGVDVSYVACGSVRATGTDFTLRLQQIFNGVTQLVTQHQPNEVAIEKVFMHRNADSALKLGQARGAALCAVFSSVNNIFEYAPRQVKQAVVGSGAAEKTQVQLMVKRLLKLDGEMGADAADAIAIALCHAHSRRLYALLQPSAVRVPVRGNDQSGVMN